MEFHEAAEALPLDKKALAKLVVDIGKNGQHVPIVTLNGKIIDGRLRWLACQQLGIKPRLRPADHGSMAYQDPVGFNLSLNIHRIPTQGNARAIAAAQVQPLYMKLSPPKGSKNGYPVIRRLEEYFHTSSGQMHLARKIVESGKLDILDAVAKGTMSLRSGEKSVHLDGENLKAAINSGRHLKDTTIGVVGAIGVGVLRANEAIDCLKRIPANDPLRDRAFQIVKDWMKRNSKKVT